MTDIRFDNRTVLITGAGGGLGRAHALAFAARGAQVVINDLGGNVAGEGGGASMAEAVVEEIRAMGGTAIANQDSVTSSAGCNAMVAAAIDTFGRIDILVNNAGIMRNHALADTDDADWDAVIATHLTGSFALTRAVWPHMAAAGYGRIIYTASSAGIFGSAKAGGYGAAKAGIAGLMHCAALEGDGAGILCNAILPNAASRMTAQAAADWGLDGMDETAMAALYGASMDPAANSALVLYLASDRCTTSHGLYSQCLGRTARVFIGVTHGWQGDRQQIATPEDIAAHWSEIEDRDAGYTVPMSAREEHITLLSGG